MDRERIYSWIVELSNTDSREAALLELSKKREVVSDLAPMLWHSFGTMAALLQEINQIYPAINPPVLTAHQSNRVCSALALLQCVASHPETRSAFLLAHIPLYLYPFLHTVSETGPFEYLRLASLGVIGALVKTDEQEVINFLLTTEIIPLCLPDQLKDQTFMNCLKGDQSTRRWLASLLEKLEAPPGGHPLGHQKAET